MSRFCHHLATLSGLNRQSFGQLSRLRGPHWASLPEQDWRALGVGAACQLTLGLLGGVRSVHRDQA